MSEHTPGPWVVVPAVDLDGQVEIASEDINHDGDYVAMVYAGKDAELVAAAPELLAALKMFDRWPLMNRQDGLRTAYDTARSVINKIEGGA